MKDHWTGILRVGLLLFAWLFFGGAYVLDVLDVSYEMHQASLTLGQVSDCDMDESKCKGFTGSLPAVVSLTVATALAGRFDRLQPLIFHEVELPTFHSRESLSIYRI
jgi:hypothetical protein